MRKIIILEKTFENEILQPERYDSLDDAYRAMVDEIKEIMGYGVDSEDFLFKVNDNEAFIEERGCDIYDGPNHLNYFWRISEI